MIPRIPMLARCGGRHQKTARTGSFLVSLALAARRLFGRPLSDLFGRTAGCLFRGALLGGCALDCLFDRPLLSSFFCYLARSALSSLFSWLARDFLFCWHSIR